MRELTKEDFKRAIPGRVRRKIAQGKIDSGEDIIMLRKFLGFTQVEFAKSMEISVHTLKNWEQGRRMPDGLALALLRIAARYPKIIKSNLERVA